MFYNSEAETCASLDKMLYTGKIEGSCDHHPNLVPCEIMSGYGQGPVCEVQCRCLDLEDLGLCEIYILRAKTFDNFINTTICDIYPLY